MVQQNKVQNGRTHMNSKTKYRMENTDVQQNKVQNGKQTGTAKQNTKIGKHKGTPI